MKKYGFVEDGSSLFRLHLGRLRMGYISRKIWNELGYSGHGWWACFKIYSGEYRNIEYAQFTILGFQLGFMYKGELK